MCKISIITINYNGLNDTCSLIESIPDDEDIEVVVVDNASYNNEATTIKNRFPNVILIHSDKNLGFAGGNNLGINAAHGDYLFLINNDTIFKGDKKIVKYEINALINRLESSDNIGIVCPKICFSWDNNPIQFAGYTRLSKITLRNHPIGFGEEDRGQYNDPCPSPYAHGAAMIIKRSALEKVGLMPECYFLYYEELDWSMMFHRAGYDIWYDPSMTIYHKESQTTGQNSPLRTYYMTRNRFIFAQRNIPSPKRFLTFFYLSVVVGGRDVLFHLLKRKFSLAKATLIGILDFAKNRQGIKDF